MWNKLSMAERAKYIQLAVSSGVTDLNNIRDTYNSFAEGGLHYEPTGDVDSYPIQGFDTKEDMYLIGY